MERSTSLADYVQFRNPHTNLRITPENTCRVLSKLGFIGTIAFATYQKKTFALLLQKQRFQFAKFLAFALP